MVPYLAYLKYLEALGQGIYAPCAIHLSQPKAKLFPNPHKEPICQYIKGVCIVFLGYMMVHQKRKSNKKYDKSDRG